jgi:hypothetical protein
MPLRGKGMLITLTEVKSRDESDFNEWYNREHIDERINLPGFHRARRYVAVKGTPKKVPKYFATYECDQVSDLATPGYLHLLANQTKWSQSVMARFTRFQRLTLRVRVDLTHGVGGALTAVRFVPDPHKRNSLLAWLQDTSLPKAIAREGMLGACAAENDLDVANAPVQDKSMDRPKAIDAEWIVLLEGADPASTAAAARKTFRRTLLKRFGVDKAPSFATYRLLFGSER